MSGGLWYWSKYDIDLQIHLETRTINHKASLSSATADETWASAAFMTAYHERKTLFISSITPIKQEL